MSKIVLRRCLGVGGDAVVGAARTEPDGSAACSVRPRAGREHRCPVCGRRAPVYDHPGPVRWRALDQGSAMCFVEHDRARVRCPEHGVRAEAVPWADEGSRLAGEFEDQAAWLACATTSSRASELLRVAWRTVGPLCSRALARLEAAGPAARPAPRRIGLDETGFAPGGVMTVATDLDRGCVVWCGEGVGAAACDAFFSSLGRAARRAVRVVAGDGAAWVDAAVRKWCPRAKRATGPSRVARWANGAPGDAGRAAWRAASREAREAGGVPEGCRSKPGRRRGRPRRGEGRTPAQAEAESRARAARGARWALPRRPEDLSEAQRARLAEVEAAGGDLWRSYVAKEAPRPVLACRDGARAAAELDGWPGSCSSSGVPRLARLAASVGARRREILRAVSMGVSNALAESTNAKIKLAVAAGRGFRNFENLRALVMLRCSPVRPSLPGRA